MNIILYNFILIYLLGAVISFACYLYEYRYKLDEDLSGNKLAEITLVFVFWWMVLAGEIIGNVKKFYNNIYYKKLFLSKSNIIKQKTENIKKRKEKLGYDE